VTTRPPHADPSTESGPASPPSTGLTRWGAPLAVVWAGVLLSAWVQGARLPAVRAPGSRLLALLLGAPATSLAALLLLRAALARTPRAPRRSDDLVVLWLVAFLFAVHALVLASATGLVRALATPTALVVAALLGGLGPLVDGLEPGSALGIRTARTLASPRAWSAAHRAAGIGLGLAALAGFGLAALSPTLAIAVAGAGGGFALLLGAVIGDRRADPPGGAAPLPEQGPAGGRPSD
jgi:hypothetical protein